DWLGGFRRWYGQGKRITPHYVAFQENTAHFVREAFRENEPEHLPLPELLAHLFGWLGTPLEVDELTTGVGKLRRMEETSPISIEELTERGYGVFAQDTALTEADIASRVVAALHCEELRTRFWAEILELRPQQRHALLLALSSDQLLLL